MVFNSVFQAADNQSRAQLGLKPGGLGRHELAALADANEVLHAHRRQGDGEGVVTGVDLGPIPSWEADDYAAVSVYADQIAVMTDGGPGFATESITYLIYKVAFAELKQGYGTALALVLFVLVVVIALAQVGLLKRREVQL